MTERRKERADARSGERGQALALFSGGLIALLIMAGLVLDGGISSVNRRDSQNAADLGALAGTQAVADFHLNGTGMSATVYAAIDEVVKANGCDPNATMPCTWTAEYVQPTTGFSTVTVGSGVNGSGAIPATAQGVQVAIQRSSDVTFLKVIGQSAFDVGAEATALTARVEGVPEGILLPIAFDPGRTPLEPGKRYKFSEDTDGPGNFSWLSWYDINSAVELEANVCEPRNPAYVFPVYVPAGPGKMNNSDVRACLDSYVNKVVYVPMWGDGGASCPDGPFDGSGANGEYCVIGVAAFRFEGYLSNPAIDDVWGTLQDWVNHTSIPAAFSGPPCVYGTPGCNSTANYLGLIR